MDHDTHVTNDDPSLSLNLSYILSLHSRLLARIKGSQSRRTIDAFGVPSQTSMSSVIASLVEETGWVTDSTTRPIPSVDKVRQPSFPSPWAFFTSGYMLGLLVVAFVLYRMQNIILPSRTPIRNRRDFMNYRSTTRNDNFDRRYNFMRYFLFRRMSSFILPLDISKTRTRLALQLPSLCALTKMLVVWSLLVLQACDKMPSWSWMRWLGTWSEKKEMSEVCWSTFCAVGSAFCVEGFIRALDGMSTTFALNTHTGPNASPFNLIGYAFLLHVYSSPLTHVRKPDGLPSRPDKHVIITIAIPLLQLTVFHYLSISKRLSSHRLIPTTLTSVLSLLHFHTTLYSRVLSSKVATPTVLPSPSIPTSSPSITSVTDTHASNGSILTRNDFGTNYPLLNYIPNMFETILLSTILLTVALNAIVQLLVRGRIERPFIGLGIINHSDDGRPSGWLSSLRYLPWDEDFAVLLLRMSTATLEATGLRGWGNEVAPIPTPLPPPFTAMIHRRRQVVEEIEYGHVRMGKLGVESLVPGRFGAVSSGSAFGSRYVRVRGNVDGVQQMMRRKPTKDERKRRNKVLKGYINEVRSIDVGADSEERLGNAQNVETRDHLLSVERRWIRAFGAFVRVLWGTLRGTYRWLCVTSKSIIRGRRQTADGTGLPKESLSRIASGITLYAESAEESDDGEGSEADHESYARFLRGEDISDDDSEDSTFSDGSDDSDSESDSSPQDDDEVEGHDSIPPPSAWERVKEEAMQLFSDLVDNHVDDDSSMIFAHMVYPRSVGPLTRRRLESVLRARQQLQNEGEDEFERVQKEVMSKTRDSNIIYGDEEEERVRRLCVICTVQERDIICWPCRCLAMCDNCRDALSSRGAPAKHRCPCCRSSVEGYSKIYIP